MQAEGELEAQRAALSAAGAQLFKAENDHRFELEKRRVEIAFEGFTDDLSGDMDWKTYVDRWTEFVANLEEEGGVTFKGTKGAAQKWEQYWPSEKMRQGLLVSALAQERAHDVIANDAVTMANAYANEGKVAAALDIIRVNVENGVLESGKGQELQELLVPIAITAKAWKPLESLDVSDALDELDEPAFLEGLRAGLGQIPLTDEAWAGIKKDLSGRLNDKQTAITARKKREIGRATDAAKLRFWDTYQGKGVPGEQGYIPPLTSGEFKSDEAWDLVRIHENSWWKLALNLLEDKEKMTVEFFSPQGTSPSPSQVNAAGVISFAIERGEGINDGFKTIAEDIEGYLEKGAITNEQALELSRKLTDFRFTDKDFGIKKMVQELLGDRHWVRPHEKAQVWSWWLKEYNRLTFDSETGLVRPDAPSSTELIDMLKTILAPVEDQVPADAIRGAMIGEQPAFLGRMLGRTDTERIDVSEGIALDVESGRFKPVLARDAIHRILTGVVRDTDRQSAVSGHAIDAPESMTHIISQNLFGRAAEPLSEEEKSLRKVLRAKWERGESGGERVPEGELSWEEQLVEANMQVALVSQGHLALYLNQSGRGTNPSGEENPLPPKMAVNDDGQVLFYDERAERGEAGRVWTIFIRNKDEVWHYWDKDLAGGAGWVAHVPTGGPAVTPPRNRLGELISGASEWISESARRVRNIRLPPGVPGS